ncbi:NAD-dependent epimerase/dehydratase family protein [Micromonospora sp. NPDC002575]|uniref:NAD-dependent epimerase/dehydratase family protein n=1 Tax=Micromonospora sp. NPDC002575 TaxID=3364222 RepID=UPI003698D637
MTTVLLLGATGFLGRHILARLDRHLTVRAPTRRECDLVATDVAALAALLRREQPDVVVNAAGRIVGSAADHLRAHALATATLIEAMTLAVPSSRLIRIGSAAEYGRVPHGIAVGEEHPAVPVSEYGTSHLAATRLAVLAASTGRLDTMVLRVFNPIGSGMPVENMLGRVSALLRTATQRGERSVSLGLHDTYRDFVDARDVADAVWAAISVRRPQAHVFNVGSGRAVPVRAAVRLLADAAGFTGTVTDGSFPPDAARSAAVPWMCADIGRSARLLGWSPRHSLAEAVAALWTEQAPVPRAGQVGVGSR